MAVLIPRLRRWFITLGIALIALVFGAYFLARNKVQNALKQVPEKIGLEIQQSAKGFTISKSYRGRTLFKIEAVKAVEFKEGGRGELHDVEITVYGRNSERFDRISGKDFEYNARTGEVTGKGEIQIDLEANPSGIAKPDQSSPENLRNPIHLTTTDLVFNQKTGDANSHGPVEFSLPQVSGSAEGLNYEANSNRLTLVSHVVVTIGSLAPITVLADKASLSKSPRVLLIDHPQLQEGTYKARAANAMVFLSADNRMERVLAQGSVVIESNKSGKISASELDISTNGQRNLLRQATLSGNVRFENPDQTGLQAQAGRVVLEFSDSNVASRIRAEQGVTLVEHLKSPAKKAGSQDFKMTAPIMDFQLFEGRVVRRADTSGPPQIVISPSPGDPVQDTTTVTAGKFEADFDRKGQFSNLHGASDVRIRSSVPGKPDRVSTSQTLDAEFASGKGITALKQQGNFAYDDGQVRASATTAQYLPDTQILLLSGSPGVWDDNMNTTAQTIRLSRLTGQAFADGDVKTTYSALTADPKRPASASPNPIHITADKMRATSKPVAARYDGNVKLWQNANEIEAPIVELDRDRRSISANSSSGHRVSTRLFQVDKSGKSTSIAISSDRVTYLDAEHRVRFEGDVIATNSDIRTTAAAMDCFLTPPSQSPKQGPQNHSVAQVQSVERIAASGSVIVRQGSRRVTGDRLIYTPADDKFVMTGGPPSIFDAEHGNVTGDSLTLFGHDGRVLVEGSKQSPAVTKARVAR